MPLGLDQFQHTELLLRDIRQGDRQPDALCIENAETPTHPLGSRNARVSTDRRAAMMLVEARS
ncbi:MAG: hypothetical protein ABSH45_06025 [Bryobacteraceae bacterium]